MATPPPPARATLGSLGSREFLLKCLACYEKLPEANDPSHGKEFIKPCRMCQHIYCATCVRDMFIGAIKDITRMPPRCCGPIYLHFAGPYLTSEEIAEFKVKYEEWSTPNPFYCPVPTCSAFLPERLLPGSVSAKDHLTDADVGTPNSKNFTCASCATDICVGCRQVAHRGSTCTSSNSGIDAETSALLKSWGYKRCPKCGHGLKKMFGCSHMDCKCGAQFCWDCLRGSNICNGFCKFNEGPDAEDEASAENPHESTSTAAASSESENDNEHNIDSGSERYWEQQDLNLGEEPDEEDVHDPAWGCSHSKFYRYRIPHTSAIFNTRLTAVECTKCWTTIHPRIRGPRNRLDAQKELTPISAGSIARDYAARHPKTETHGNRVPTTKTTTTGSDLQLSASADLTNTTGKNKTLSSHSSETSTPAPASSPAYECTVCSSLLCETCISLAVAETGQASTRRRA